MTGAGGDRISFTRPERRDQLFGGSGFVLVESLSGTLTSPFTTALLCELSPGGSVGVHVQQTDSEIVIALAGEAVLYVDDKPNAVVPGRVVGLPLGARLSIDNASPTEAFRYLIVKARP